VTKKTLTEKLIELGWLKITHIESTEQYDVVTTEEGLQVHDILDVYTEEESEQGGQAS
jgi:hypothetical protein